MPNGTESGNAIGRSGKPLKMNRHRDPGNTNSQLGRAYLQLYARVMVETQPKLMGYVSMDVMDGIESFAIDNPRSQVAQMREEMLQAIGPDTPAGDPDAIGRFSAKYKDASAIVFPATSAYLAVCHALHEYSTSHSLSLIDLEILRAIDLEAHRNQVLDTFRKDLKSRLDQVSASMTPRLTAKSSRFMEKSLSISICANECLPREFPNEKDKKRLISGAYRRTASLSMWKSRPSTSSAGQKKNRHDGRRPERQGRTREAGTGG